ncbi:MAG: hypothetical protein HYU39_07490 [Thaumarchaeota archaeon]|nr:hypothetical protein [Nitrososphaerota archaeon]
MGVLGIIRRSMLLRTYLALVTASSLLGIYSGIYVENVKASNPGVDPELLLEFDPVFPINGLFIICIMIFSVYILAASIDKTYPTFILLLPLAELALIAIRIFGDESLFYPVLSAQILLSSLLLLASYVSPSNPSRLEIRRREGKAD